MNIDWKILSVAMIISIIVNGIVGIVVLVDYTVRTSNAFDVLVSDYNRLISETSSEGEISMTMTIVGESVSLLWIWIVLFVCSLVVLTLVFYFSINFLKDRKK